MNNQGIVVAITGASGAVYAVRLLQVLAASGRTVHLTISPSGVAVIRQELGIEIDLQAFDPATLLNCQPPWAAATESAASSPANDLHDTQAIHYYHYQDYMTPIASGSFLTAGMIICPCSGSTLSAIARSASSNLIQRAAEVHLKEQRKLVIVPRETPLSVFQLENMHRLATAGVCVLPAAPGWYHGVQGLSDLVDFVVGRIIDQFEIPNRLIGRWGEA
ncbi:UbiX family flavin prenyltransferase [Roseimaritima ulvae]|uniref:Flavin prenyltransferase UbiX n=1 Tax=Roseimaritima ulvae TaxID=980254 RepID=A0A5B9QQJ0_9BACT|nr:flavin prenyltransferase UbiX [Roseimaritima ulvae]QEG39920.1 putative aromatic acid decarboxylase [Roseimaritima ulvae]